MPTPELLAISQVQTRAQIDHARELFVEYAQSLGFSLCFQNFDQELAGLPGDYAPPDGRLLLAEHDGKIAGCAALHRLDATSGEMKRLYVRPAFRGLRLGRILAERILAEAKSIGFQRIRLDTVAGVMDDAIALYRRLGFREIEPYRQNPIAGALYMELDL
jgi:ribosomal protein S18 acetylase RimI-like enzyme